MGYVLNSTSALIVTSLPAFSAKGLRRCLVPGVGCTVLGGVSGSGSAVADFWRGKDGDVWLRVTWMGQVWSFHARGPAGESIPDDQDFMAVFADFVSRELCRWMTEDAPDTPPFDACTAAEQENFSSGRKA